MRLKRKWLPSNLSNLFLESQSPPEQPAVPGEEENTENEPNETRKEEERKLPPKVKTGKHPSLLKVRLMIVWFSNDCEIITGMYCTHAPFIVGLSGRAASTVFVR